LRNIGTYCGGSRPPMANEDFDRCTCLWFIDSVYCQFGVLGVCFLCICLQLVYSGNQQVTISRWETAPRWGKNINTDIFHFFYIIIYVLCIMESAFVPKIVFSANARIQNAYWAVYFTHIAQDIIDV